MALGRARRCSNIVVMGSSLSRAGTLRGIVHGRFQPFHNQHLEYLRIAAAHSEELLVGITNPERDGAPGEPTAVHRQCLEENPYTYWERLLMVEAVLESEGIEGRVVPFPISEPKRLCDYLPVAGTHYLRVFDAWGEEKVRRLKQLGLEVVVLQPGAEKTLSGSEVRACIRERGPWRDMIPDPVVHVLELLSDEADRCSAA